MHDVDEKVGRLLRFEVRKYLERLLKKHADHIRAGEKAKDLSNGAIPWYNMSNEPLSHQEEGSGIDSQMRISS